MKTDSENNMMNQLFSLHSIGGGRFSLLLLLLFNFQMIQAVCRNDETPSSDMATPSTPLFISEGTLVSGIEKISISHPAKEKIKKKLKRKDSLVPGKRKQKKKENISQPVKGHNKTELAFNIDNQSEKSLLAISDSDMQIVRPSQNTMKFLLSWIENKQLTTIHLLDIFLRKDYKSHFLSHLVFFQNFNRPPPSCYGYH
ncbi:hypothetical protein KB553_06625 [Chryseobacterium rhizoplanae]|uniref:hypothetical protein n=1 Tax=Chryseobacterium rhizoplanae TaxID=1609531 RepID=UPI001CE31EBF|nr:hypothetical protein [Chryseobacterium rhizoplanae]UCA61200.1 hypothetical protein KB553_06625 [Chryseobacterium rhizoplanae]